MVNIRKDHGPMRFSLAPTLVIAALAATGTIALAQTTGGSAPSTPGAKTPSAGKEPRSPDRLKTNDNPPLNRDCVIAYAESKDKKNKQGILRQVKSERFGVFTESDVVFAARFFVED